MFELWVQSVLLTVEAQGVIAQRLALLAAGDAAATVEARRMVSEKVGALCEACCTLMGGGGAVAVVARYREHVAANALRLAGPGPGAA